MRRCCLGPKFGQGDGVVGCVGDSDEFNAGHQIGEHLPLNLIEDRIPEGARSLSDFLSAFVRPPDLQDLAALGRDATVAFLTYVGDRPRPWHLNPTFAQSAALGGADADIICGGLLVDWKSTTQKRIVGRSELWQIAGYLLADTPDEYGIRAVAVQAQRWDGWATWSADAYLERLSGCERSLPDWRAEFADTLAQATPADV